MADEDDAWWYCLKDNRVEHGAGCPGKDRMGPYESEDAARHAFDLARERNEAWRRRSDDD
jgi:hypothetical protein